MRVRVVRIIRNNDMFHSKRGSVSFSSVLHQIIFTLFLSLTARKPFRLSAHALCFQAQIEKAALLKKLKRKPGDPAAAAAEDSNLTPAQQEQRAAAAAAAEAASGTRSDRDK